MKAKTRLCLSLGALALLVFVLAIVSITSIWRLRGEGRDLLKANYASIEYMQILLERMSDHGDTAEVHTAMRDMLSRQQGNITEELEQAATDTLANALRSWTRSRSDGAADTLRSGIDAVIEINRDAILRRVGEAEDRGEKALVWISLTGTFCALIALSLLFTLPAQFLDPISKLTEGIERVAGGNYRERVELKRNDEFGHMAMRFNAMAAELERWENSNLARVMDEKSRAEAVINSLKDASLGMDEHGRILFVNQPMAELLDRQSDDLIGLSAREAARSSDLLRSLIEEPGSGPLKIVLNGREQFYIMEQVPILKGRQNLGSVTVLRNVTPFEEKDRAKTQFLATVSHELKTPLASTDIGLTLLERQQETRLSADQAAIVADLRRDHKRLLRMVSELLDLTQLETGNIQVRPVHCALVDLLGRSIEAVRTTSLEKGVRFEERIERNAQLVLADPEKVLWVLVNVLSNAVRYSPGNGVIELATTATDGKVHLSVSDHGPGIPPDEQGRLFRRFSPGSGPLNGTGLGLSIARDLMRAMGGEIRLERSTAEGTTFVLTFVSV